MIIRRVLRALDRTGTRAILAAIATGYACLLNRRYVLRVFFDRETAAWGRAALGEVVIDGVRFDYYAADLRVVGGRTPWTRIAHRYWLDRAPVAPGETVVDVGAEVGSDLHAFSTAVGPAGRVLAVEAHPATFSLLQRTVVLSLLRNVVCVHGAVTSEPSTVYISDGDTTLSSTLGERGHPVPGLPLDTIATSQGVEDIGLLKLNIEGSERAAVSGMTQVLARARQVIIACHDFRADRGEAPSFRTRSVIVGALVAAGFLVEPVRTDVPDYERDHVVAKRSYSSGTR